MLGVRREAGPGRLPHCAVGGGICSCLLGKAQACVGSGPDHPWAISFLLGIGTCGVGEELTEVGLSVLNTLSYLYWSQFCQL